MKNQFLAFVCIILISMACQSNKKSKITYPNTPKANTIDTYFGQNVPDPYRWLEDDQSAQTKEWVISENKVTNQYLNQIPFREHINDRLTKLWNFTRMGTPFKEGGNYFYSKNDGLQNQNVIYIQHTLADTAKVILDPNSLSGKGTVALSTISVSPSGKYLGYGIASAGSDWNEFFVKDIRTGVLLTDHIQWIKFSNMAWFGDGFFYSRFPKPNTGDQLKGENINNKVYYHRIGTNQESDQLVYEDNQNPNLNYSPTVSSNEKWLIITVTESTSGNAIYIKNLEKTNNPVVKLINSFDSDFEFVDCFNSKLLFHTNFQAPNYKLIAFNTQSLSENLGADLIPQNESDVLLSVTIAGEKLFGNYQKDAHSIIKGFDSTGHYLYNINLPTLGTVSEFNGKINENEVFYNFSSYTYPSVIYKYNTDTNQSDIFYQTNIDFDVNSYETNQVFFTSKDGTKVPMFLVHKKGLNLDSSNPVWLYGYGGFNISLKPAFDIRRLIWLENGGIYAVVNLRGGGEYGENWHLSGTKMLKQNVFDDFISAANYLVSNNYTQKGKIVAQGGSNGGLLIGAVVNQAPDLFGAAFPQVGVMDMLRYHKFTIGRFWATDYGTSEESEDMFKYLFKYSPIHNINESINYPPILVTTADHDDRVVPAHSFKYIATLQEKNQGNNPTLIRIETDAGHGAGKPTSKTIDEWTDIYSFAFYNLNIQPK